MSNAARRVAPWALTLVLAAPLLAGCSVDRDVLARVGDVRITSEDFLAAARGSVENYPGSPDSAKRMLLDDLVRRELLVQGATLSGIGSDSAFALYRRQLEQQLMRDRLFQQFLGGAILVSPAEVDAFYRQRQTEGHARVLFSSSLATIRAAQAELARGQDFASVATRFNVPGVLPNGGDLGYVQPGSLIPPLDGQLLDAPIGQVVGPFQVPTQGWFLFQVADRRPAQQPPLETVRAQLAGVIQQRKQRAVMMRAIDRLGRVYDVEVEPAAANTVVQRLSPGLLGGAPPPLDANSRSTVLARWRGGVYTLGEAQADLESSPNPPAFQMLPTVQRWIENQALERAARIEARRRLLDQDPQVERAVRERVKSMLLDAYYGRAVGGHVQVTDADVRAMHAARASAFMRLDEVRLLTTQLKDSAAAAQLVLHGGQTATLREAAAMAAPGARVRAETIRYPTTDPFWGSLQATFMGMAPRGIQTFRHPQGGWIVIQLQSKNQGSQSFEELPPAIVQYLRNQAVEAKRERRLAMLSDSLERAIPIRTFLERLARIPWPPPGATPQGPSPQG